MKASATTSAVAALSLAHGVLANDISRIFAFGSSWSANGFDINKAQPSQSNVYGNTDPTHNILAFEGGLNYVEFLTTRYNTSETYLYDLAVAGGVVTSQTTSNTLVTQYNDKFKAKYATGSAFSPDHTLFNVWMCDNDVNNYFMNPVGGQAANISNILDVYWNDIITGLYNNKARKFLIVGVPAQDLSPQVQSETKGNPSKYLSYKNAFDDELVMRMNKFSAAHTDTKFSYYNSSAFMYPILKNPTASGFNANTSCTATDGSGQKNCIWHNGFHASSELHNLMAKDMVANLKAVGFYS